MEVLIYMCGVLRNIFVMVIFGSLFCIYNGFWISTLIVICCVIALVSPAEEVLQYKRTSAKIKNKYKIVKFEQE